MILEHIFGIIPWLWSLRLVIWWNRTSPLVNS